MSNINKNKYAFEEIYDAYTDISLNDFGIVKKNRCKSCNVIINKDKTICGSQVCKQKYYCKKYGVKLK